MAPRKIIHLDLDAFYCAVEELRDPSLSGLAFAVGGRPKERGVVASCSYAARLRGIHSAMPMARAIRICPGLKIIPPRHAIYEKVSEQVMQIVRNMTPLVEQISIDEAFLDLSDLPEALEGLCLSLQKRIQSDVSLPCSLGAASNKLVAKIANDIGKAAGKRDRPGLPPNAITIVPPGQEAKFLAPLPVEALWGVGPKTAQRLAEIGILTIGELATWPAADLVERFGKIGWELSDHARGLDERPLELFHEVKSISQETTFAQDIRNPETLLRTLHQLTEKVGRRLREEHKCIITVKIKLRWSDFTTLTRQVTLKAPTDQDETIFQAAQGLLGVAWKGRQSIRLIGVGVSGFRPPIRQLSLWELEPVNKEGQNRQLQEALDSLRHRYGDKAIRHLSDLESSDSISNGKI